MANENRFTGKSDVYEQYRPSYPIEVINYLTQLIEEIGLDRSTCKVADIGAGTGKFTRLLLERGFHVIAVEPNQDMATKLEQLQHQFPKQLTIQIATAEQTKLETASIDLIVCAQAFHWVNEQKAKLEWQRILKPKGRIALIWNQRQTKANAFMQRYEQLFLNYDTTNDEQKAYRNVGHKSVNVEHLTQFFGMEPNLYTVQYEQLLDEMGLIGRVTSSSYALQPENQRYSDYINEIKQLYSEFEEDGKVKMLYETQCYSNKY